MSLSKALKDRSYAEFLRDPNFTGAFVGGPPLLSTEQMEKVLDTSNDFEERARKALERIKKRYEDTSHPSD